MDEKYCNLILREAQKINENAMRVLLLATREFESRELNYPVTEENNLVNAGLIGFLDPAKPFANDAIQRFYDLGVSVKVLTGDNELVTK